MSTICPVCPRQRTCDLRVNALVLLTDPLHHNPVPTFRWNVERLSSYADGFLLILGDHRAKVLRALADHIDTPPSHGSPPSYPMANNYDHDGETDSKDCIQKDGPSSAIAS